MASFAATDFKDAQDRNGVDSVIDGKIGTGQKISASEYAAAIAIAKDAFKTRKAQNCAAAAAKVTPAGPQTAKSVKIA